MDCIKIEVKGNIIKITDRPRKVTSGTVGLKAQFSFDSQWDGLSKTAIFRACTEKRVLTCIDSEVTVPWEVLKKPDVWLSVGVYGTNAEGTIVIPTIWANAMLIVEGTTADGDPSTDPTLPVWAQLGAEIDALKIGYPGYQGVIPAGILYGDVNGDGEVNAKDARQILLYLSGEITEAALRLELADVNGDGVVDETDAELIEQYAAGVITGFAAGKYVNWKPDGAYYYHDLIVGGITKDMAITLIAPGVKLVKTECMDGYIRVFVTEPPAKDAPFSLGSGDSGGGTGEPGFSPIAKVEKTEDGAVITITDENGTTTATVLNGKDGKTPVKGVDYFTEEDKEELAADAFGGTIKEIDLSNFDNGSISEILSDGTENIYPVAFDESRRPISIGGLAITWGDVGV